MFIDVEDYIVNFNVVFLEHLYWSRQNVFWGICSRNKLEKFYARTIFKPIKQNLEYFGCGAKSMRLLNLQYYTENSRLYIVICLL